MHRIFTAACLALATLAPTSLASPAVGITDLFSVKVTVFGDSLSDNGNAFQLDNQVFPPPPYDGGRFSNGPVWNEKVKGNVLSVKLSNKAYAGATTGTSTGYVTDLSGTNYAVPSMLEQVNSYTASGQLKNDFTMTSMYVLFAGGNDYNNKLVKGLSNVTVDNVISNIRTSATTLINGGARNIVLINIPPASKSPRLIAMNNPTVSAIMDGLITQHNAALTPLVADLKTAGAKSVLVFDMFSLVKDMAENPTTYGFTNVQQPCVDLVAGTTCGTPDEYMFWDQLHPTAKTHGVIAEKMTAFLKANGRLI
ncbi:hypothetical protein HDV00_002377 [Rhizophlyctis rosea]|nr:hypothetical protein HDV00_002377 [Rhizophlyctis rosea]